MKKTLLVAFLLGGISFSYSGNRDTAPGKHVPERGPGKMASDQCDPVSAPYLIDFEDTDPGQLPSCTTTAYISSNNPWTTESNPGYGFSSKALYHASNGTEASNDWFFTMGVYLEAGVPYKFSFKYGSGSFDKTEQLEVAYGNTADAAGMTNAITMLTNITGTSAGFFASQSPLTVSTSGVYYFGFKCFSAANQGGLLLDDIAINDWECTLPVNLSVTNVTPDNALIKWESSPATNAMFYQYCITSDGIPVEGPTTTGLSATAAPNFPLDAETTYVAFVRSFCAGFWSDWSEGVTFTTPCLPTGIPYTQNFEFASLPGLPSCTSAYAGEGASSWHTADNPGSGFSDKALEYSAGNSPANAWFFTPGLQLEAGVNYKISFRYGNNSTTTVEKMEVKYGSFPTASAMVGPIASFFNISNGTATVYVSYPISVQPSGAYYLGFHAFSNAEQGNLYVDDISVEVWECNAPQNVAVNNITATEANFSWDAPAGGETAGLYQYAVTTSSEIPSSGDFAFSGNATASQLESGTTYYFYVRSYCSGAWSDWAEPVTFTTTCDAVPLPYEEHFESATLPALPNCTSGSNGGSSNSWATTSAPGSGFDNNTLQYTGNASAADAWFFTKGFPMEAGKMYKISYRYGNNDAAHTEKLSVYMGNNPDAATMLATTPFGNYNAISGGAQQSEAFGPISVTADGTYYLGFHARSDANQGELYLDDIVVEAWTCDVPGNVAVNNVTATEATLSWETPGGNPVQVFQYAVTTDDTAPESGAYFPGNSVQITDLQPETTYYVFTRAMCSGTFSDWSSTVTFTTEQNLGVGDVAFKGFSVYPNPVKEVVTIRNSDNIDQVEIVNLLGQCVFSKTYALTSVQVDMTALPMGSYIVKVKSGDTVRSVKLLKD